MKRLIVGLLISRFYCKAADPAKQSPHRQLAVHWVNGLNFTNNNSSGSSIDPEVEKIKNLHIQALEQLLDVQNDKRSDVQALSENQDICSSHIKNKDLKNAARVYARINLAIVFKTRAFEAIKDVGIEACMQQSRKHFVIALALARKSGDWQKAQEEFIHRTYDSIKNTRLKDFHNPIKDTEVDAMQEKLDQDPELQFRTY